MGTELNQNAMENKFLICKILFIVVQSVCWGVEVLAPAFVYSIPLA